MSFPVFLVDHYVSRYSLLGTMAKELARAFQRRGCVINPEGLLGKAPSLLVWFNFLDSIDDLPAEALRPGSDVAFVQILVDHPLAINTHQMDRTAGMANFRLLTPAVDGAHTLRLRWPSLTHGHMLHAVCPDTIADADAIEASHTDDAARPLPIVAMGHIHSEGEVEALLGALPRRLHSPSRQVLDLMIANPWVSFEQALDIAMLPDGIVPGNWDMAAAVWRFVTAALNRHRRIEMVEALQGLPVRVYGGPAWRDVCVGTLSWKGQVEYADVPTLLRSAKVCLAWGPTQFTHSFSERLLHSMSSGAAPIAEDRALIRSCLDPAGDPARSVALFEPCDLGSMRDHAERLLHDARARTEAALAGRAVVASNHTWDDRLDMLAAVGSNAIAA